MHDWCWTWRLFVLTNNRSKKNKTGLDPVFFMVIAKKQQNEKNLNYHFTL